MPAGTASLLREKVDRREATLQRDVHADPDRRRARPVIVHLVFEAVGALRQLADQLPPARFRPGEDVLDRVLDQCLAIIGVEPAKALGPDMVSVALGHQVTAHLFGDAYVAQDHAEQVGFEFPAAHQPDRQHPQPFRKGIAHALHGFRPGLRAAHVDMVRGRHRVAEQRLALEHRRHQEHVGEVPAAQIRVVGGEHVAGPQRLGRHVFQHAPDHIRHGAEMAGGEVALRDQPPTAVEQAGREILAFPHRFRERSAAQRSAHLVGDGDQAVPDDGKRDGIDLLSGHRGHAPALMSMIRFPAALTETTSPGRTTVVASRSSTRAGPAIRSPCVRA